MKTKLNLKFAWIPVALIGTATLSASHEVQFEDLPVPVKQTVNRYRDTGEVKRVERQTYNGSPIYDVVIKRAGPNRELHITESGALLENDPTFVAHPGPLRTKKLQLSDLPQPVQHAIRTQAGTASIDDITQINHAGRVIYEVEFQRDGQNQELHIASDGTLFRESQAPQPVAASSQPAAPAGGTVSRKISVKQLPDGARRAIEREAAGATIEDIDQMTKNGRTFYEVTFKRNGRNVDLDVAPDGSFTDQNGSPIVASAQPSAARPAGVSQILAGDMRVTFADLPLPVQTAVQSEVGSGKIDMIERKVRRGRTLYQVAYSKNDRARDLFVGENGSVISSGSNEAGSNQNVSLSGASKVTFSSLPAPVQNTLRVRAGGSPIEDIDKGLLNGRTAYQAAFKKNGQHTELTVAEDGSVIGGLPAVPRAVAAAPEAGAPLRDARKVTLNDLPSAVLNTIRVQAGSAPIEDTDRGTLSGRVVYEAAFKKEGRHTELRVAEDGSLVGTVAAETPTPQP